MHYGRVHRLDRIIANIPAKLLDSKSLTLGFSRKQIWPVYLCYSLRGGLAIKTHPGLSAVHAGNGAIRPAAKIPVWRCASTRDLSEYTAIQLEGAVELP